MLLSMVLVSRHAIPEMRKNGRGAIVNMSSVSGRKYLLLSWNLDIFNAGAVLGGNPSLLYPTTKGAIIQMTRAMAAQHGPENIRVNCVCPGMVFTPMVRGRGMAEKMRQDRQPEPFEAGTHRVGRWLWYGAIPWTLFKVKVTDPGYTAIVFLCSKGAKWITGLIMPVDGGVRYSLFQNPSGLNLTFSLTDHRRKGRQTSSEGWYSRRGEYDDSQ